MDHTEHLKKLQFGRMSLPEPAALLVARAVGDEPLHHVTARFSRDAMDC